MTTLKEDEEGVQVTLTRCCLLRKYVITSGGLYKVNNFWFLKTNTQMIDLSREEGELLDQLARKLKQN